MNLIQRGESQLLDSGSLGLGQLHIGASDTICRYFLVPYLKQFHKKFPNVPIKVTNATSLSCVDLLDQGKVDLIVTNFPNSNLNHSYIQKTVCNFTDVFIANPAYFNLKQQEIPFEELKQYQSSCSTAKVRRASSCTTCFYSISLSWSRRSNLAVTTFWSTLRASVLVSHLYRITV